MLEMTNAQFSGLGAARERSLWGPAGHRHQSTPDNSTLPRSVSYSNQFLSPDSESVGIVHPGKAEELESKEDQPPPAFPNQRS